MTKKEQLKAAFKASLTNFHKEIMRYEEGSGSGYLSAESIVDDTTNELLKEVSIRTPLK